MNAALLLSIGVGGFFGAISRFLIASLMQKLTGSLFPIGTLTVNVLGSFIIGILFIYFEHTVQPQLKALLITGFLGALTTFSTFSLETYLMLGEGSYLRAGLNILLNLIFTVTATTLGIIVAKKIWGV